MLKKTIQESKSYLFQIQKYVWISLAIFLVAAFSGYYFAQHFPSETAAYFEEMKKFFSSINQESPWQTFLSIFKNNVDAMLIVVAMGIFAGLFSLTFLLTNGFLIGMVAFLFTSQSSWLVLASGILPHGIIEIPRMLFSAAIGFRIGKTAIQKLLRKNVSLTREVARGIKFAVTVIVPLLFLAALIEAYITPYFIALAQLATGTA
jgi:stage II sporulation protein M